MLGSPVAQIAFGAVYGLMFLGLMLIVFRPFFPGLAIISATVLGYYALGCVVLPPTSLAEVPYLALPGVVLATALGLGSGWWTEKLGVRFTYAGQDIGMAAFLGMVIAMLLYLPLVPQVIGMSIGASLAMIYVQKRPPLDAIRNGPVAVYSMLGPRGFQLLMALVVCELSGHLIQSAILLKLLALGAY